LKNVNSGPMASGPSSALVSDGVIASLTSAPEAAPVVVTSISTVVRQTRDGALAVRNLCNSTTGVLADSAGVRMLATCCTPQLLAGAMADGRVAVWEMGMAASHPTLLGLPGIGPLLALAVSAEVLILSGVGGVAFRNWRIGGQGWRHIRHGAAADVTGLAFDRTVGGAVWLATGHGPFVLDTASSTPVLVPPLLGQDSPWHSDVNVSICRRATSSPVDLSVVLAEPSRGPRAVAVAGGNSGCVVATGDRVYVGSVAAQAIRIVAVSGVVSVSILRHVFLRTPEAMYIADRHGQVISHITSLAGCGGVVATESGARVVAGGVATTVVVV